MEFSIQILVEIVFALIVFLKTLSGILQWKKADGILGMVEKVIKEVSGLFKVKK